MSATDQAASARELPPGLWDRLRRDPVRSPEHIALAAARTFGPQAQRWADDKRARYAVTPAELAGMAKKRHATMARFEGAAAHGYDPRDPMRPAELLVLRDVYPDPVTARRALDGIGATVVEAYIGSKMQRDEALALRLAKLVGVHSARRLAGRLIPGVAIAFNAVGNERSTRALADRANRFYGG